MLQFWSFCLSWYRNATENVDAVGLSTLKYKRKRLRVISPTEAGGSSLLHFFFFFFFFFLSTGPGKRKLNIFVTNLSPLYAKLVYLIFRYWARESTFPCTRVGELVFNSDFLSQNDDRLFLDQYFKLILNLFYFTAHLFLMGYLVPIPLFWFRFILLFFSYFKVWEVG